MKSEPATDPVVTRRAESLITVGFRTTRERRDAMSKEALREGRDLSSLIRIAVEEYLAKAAKR